MKTQSIILRPKGKIRITTKALLESETDMVEVEWSGVSAEEQRSERVLEGRDYLDWLKENPN